MAYLLMRVRRLRTNLHHPITTATIKKRSYSSQTDDFSTTHPTVWGYQKPSKFGLPDYSPHQLYNRASQAPLMRLIESYRRHAHRSASLDPLSLTPRPPVPALDPRRYGFKLSSEFLNSQLPLNHQSTLLPEQSVPGLSEKDEYEIYNVDGLIGMGPQSRSHDHRFSLDQIIQRLQQVYCGRIAYEFMHLPNKSEREWISEELESKVHDLSVDQPTQVRYHELLHRSEAFDNFLASKFPNVKRYGLEGGESMLVALDRIFNESAQRGIKDVVIAMPHRGRLNLLTQLLSLDLNVMLKKLKGEAEIPEELLSQTPAYTGDVLSHLSTSSVLEYQNPLNVHVLPNPSHLEAVSPVGLGFTRAFSMIERTGPYRKSDIEQIGNDSLSVQIHGDAAFGGQGVVAETLNLTTLPHFTVGGSIRLVLNNQLGYTTPATEGRTAFYATDIGKSIEAPIIHVNGEYPEDVSKALSLAVAFRNKFHKDVLVDLVVYRRWGHNELDEPTYTSPHMYRKIQSLLSVPKKYEKELLEAEVISEDGISGLRSKIENEFKEAMEGESQSGSQPHSETKKVSGLMNLKEFVGNQPDAPSTLRGSESDVETGVNLDRLRAAGEASVSTPKDFNVHPRLQKMHIQRRLQALSDSTGEKAEIDFSTAEALAFGTILEDGYDIRLSGQDSGRGTFSQRHALLTDQVVEGKTIVPLNQLSAKNPQRGGLEIVNSPLSEYAVLGFELGLSYLTSRSCLTLWEAQFGDFVNTAQVVVDQFLVSGQFKWATFDTGLVLLIPHGLDGAGPEHSSCRAERFLQAANEPYSFKSRSTQQGKNGHNLSVCNPSTPAQYFHLLRRQIKSTRVRDPRGLVICSPKTILRLRESFSSLKDMDVGTKWNEVLDDPSKKDVNNKENVEKILICSGKLYYDLAKKRKSLGKDFVDQVAIVRVEEITPFPYKSLHKIIKSYSNVKSVVWVQEEPENAGPLNFVIHRIQEVLNQIEHDDPFNESLSSPSSSQISLNQINDEENNKDIKLSFIARPSCASPATGIGSVYKEQKGLIEELSFSSS